MSSLAISPVSHPVVEVRFTGHSENCLKVGDRFPDVVLAGCDSEGQDKLFTTASELKNRAVIVFTVPHAATSIFTRLYLAGFRQAENKLLGYFDIDRIICIVPDKVDVARRWMVSRGTSFIDMWVDKVDPIGIDYESECSTMVIRNGVIEWIEIEKIASGCIKTQAQSVYDYLRLSRSRL